MELKCHQMSTPADNTRYKQTRIPSVTPKKNKEANKEANTGSKELVVNREQRQVMKDNIFSTNVCKKNALIKQWLIDSKGIDVGSAKLNQTFDQSKSVNVDAAWHNRKKNKQCYSALVKDTPASQVSSEVSFNVAKLYKAKEMASVNIRHNSEEMDDSINFGESALSGRSSTARRRANKTEKMKRLSMLHSKGGEMHDQLIASENMMSSDYNTARGSQQLTEAKSYAEWEDRSNPPNTIEKGSDVTKSDVDADSIEPNGPALNTTQGTADDKSIEIEAESKKKSNDIEQDEQPNNVDVLQRFREGVENQDSATICEMFELIITKLSLVQENITQVKNTQKSYGQRIDALERSLDVCYQAIDDVDGEVEEVVDANIKIVQALIKEENEISVIKDDMQRIMQRNNKGCFLINGLVVKKGQIAKDVVKSFLKKVMGITDDIEIQSAHSIGKSIGSPIWFQLYDANDAIKLFEHVSNLKGKLNAKNKKYQLREYLTDQDRETKTRNQDIKMENARLPDSHKCEIFL